MVANQTVPVKESGASCLVKDNLGLADNITRKLKRRYSWVNSEDLYSYSLLSLTVSARIYDNKRGVSFQNFATQKGMFLAIDEMRKDGLLRRRDSNLPKMYNFSDATGRDQDASSWQDEIPGEGDQLQMRSIETRDMCRSLLAHLSTDDRELLVDYYLNQMTFRQMAASRGTSESTICVRHQSLLNRLRRISRSRQLV